MQQFLPFQRWTAAGHLSSCQHCHSSRQQQQRARWHAHAHMCTPVILLAAGAHFYCETLDISRPFPSERPAHQPSWPFVWNKALSAPFRAAGLDGPATVCPALLQVRQLCACSIASGGRQQAGAGAVAWARSGGGAAAVEWTETAALWCVLCLPVLPCIQHPLGSARLQRSTHRTSAVLHYIAVAGHG